MLHRKFTASQTYNRYYDYEKGKYLLDKIPVIKSQPLHEVIDDRDHDRLMPASVKGFHMKMARIDIDNYEKKKWFNPPDKDWID